MYNIFILFKIKMPYLSLTHLDLNFLKTFKKFFFTNYY